MARWDYKKTLMDLDQTVPSEKVACDDSGTCRVNNLPEQPGHSLDLSKKILVSEGE